MFVVTMNRKGVKRLIIIACSLLLVCTTLIGGVILLSDDVTEAMASGDANANAVNGVNDVVKIFDGFGITTDITTAEVSSVVIPADFNDDFVEFNSIIMESGGDISGLKGDTVERWKVLATNRSMKDEIVWAVTLVRNNKAVGCYLLCEPSGQVRSVLDDTMQVMATVIAQTTEETTDVMATTSPEEEVPTES